MLLFLDLLSTIIQLNRKQVVIISFKETFGAYYSVILTRTGAGQRGLFHTALCTKGDISDAPR